VQNKSTADCGIQNNDKKRYTDIEIRTNENVIARSPEGFRDDEAIPDEIAAPFGLAMTMSELKADC